MVVRPFLPAVAVLVVLVACGSAGQPASLGASPASNNASPAASTPSASTAAGGVLSANPSAPALLPRVTIPYISIGVPVLPFWVAYETGLFKQYGLDVATEYIQTSTTVTQAILAGQVQVAESAEEAVVSADLSGGDIVVIAAGIDRLLFSLYTPPGIQSVAQLKNKRVGVSKIGASTDFAARFALSQNGLDPARDVTILQMGEVPAILAGLQSGSIDGGILSPPTTAKAKQAGFKELANLAQYDLAFYQGPLVAKESWVKEHHQEALNVVRGYLAGIASTLRDKQTAERILGKYTKTDDAAILEDSYQSLIKVLPKASLPSVDAIKTGLSQVNTPEARAADPSRFIDASLVEQLQKSGFIDSLYR